MEMQIAILCDETPDGKGCEAIVEENYDYATIDPNRIYVYRDGWTPLQETGLKVDFISISRLFMQENRFYAWPQRVPADVGRDNVYCRKLADALVDYQKVIDEVTEMYGEFLPFFQALLIQDLYPMLLTEKTCSDMEVDVHLLVDVLRQVDDDMISGQGCIPEDVMVKILSLKHEIDICEKFVYRSGKLNFDNLTVVSLKEIPFMVEHIEAVRGICRLSGMVMLPLEHRGIEYYYTDNRGKEYEIEWEDQEELFFLGERMHTRKRFIAQIKIGDEPIGLRFMYRYQRWYRARIRMVFSDELGMVEDTRHNFTVLKKHFFKIDKRILFIAPLRFKTRIKLLFTFPQKSIKMYLCGKKTDRE